MAIFGVCILVKVIGIFRRCLVKIPMDMLFMSTRIIAAIVHAVECCHHFIGIMVDMIKYFITQLTEFVVVRYLCFLLLLDRVSKQSIFLGVDF